MPRQRRARLSLTQNELFEHFSHVLRAASALNEAEAIYPNGAVFSTALTPEDMVITDMIVRHQLDIDLVLSETVQRDPRTLACVACPAKRYGREIALSTSVLSHLFPSRTVRITSAPMELPPDGAFVARWSVDPLSGRALCRPLAGGWTNVWHYLDVDEVPFNVLQDASPPTLHSQATRSCSKAIQPRSHLMASLNKVQLIGNLGRDPEVRYTPVGRRSAPSASRRQTTVSTSNRRSGSRKPTGTRSSSSVDWPRSPASSWPRGARSTSKAGCARASGKTRKARTGIRPKSWPTRCNCSAPDQTPTNELPKLIPPP